MRNITIYVVEARGQHDEITTPTLYTYKVFGSMKEAQEHLDMVEANLKANPKVISRRSERVVESRNADGKWFPRQTWYIKEHHLSINE